MLIDVTENVKKLSFKESSLQSPNLELNKKIRRMDCMGKKHCGYEVTSRRQTNKKDTCHKCSKIKPGKIMRTMEEKASITSVLF
jgi:hypothetical protein